MRRIYDNGEKMIGRVDDILNVIENSIMKGAINDNSAFDLYKDLKAFEDKTRIVVIDYDNPMSYTIDSWGSEDICDEIETNNESEEDYIVTKTEMTLSSVYVDSCDMTMIIEDTWVDGEPRRTEIKGFYYGKPSEENTNIFKNKGVVCNYEK